MAGEEKRSLSGHSGQVTCCAFAPDGKTVLSGASFNASTHESDNTLKIWDVATGQCNYTLSGHSAAVNACAFSPDGKVILSAAGQYRSNDNTLKLWDASTGVYASIYCLELSAEWSHSLCSRSHGSV